MSHAAKKLASTPSVAQRIKRGPANVCGPIYEADLEDCEAIEEFRQRPNETWKTAQKRYDDLIGVDPAKRIHNDKFRYHWRRWCFCWPDDLRQS